MPIKISVMAIPSLVVGVIGSAKRYIALFNITRLRLVIILIAVCY